jgi:hypothetical protein
VLLLVSFVATSPPKISFIHQEDMLCALRVVSVIRHTYDRNPAEWFIKKNDFGGWLLRWLFDSRILGFRLPLGINFLDQDSRGGSRTVSLHTVLQYGKIQNPLLPVMQPTLPMLRTATVSSVRRLPATSRPAYILYRSS